MNEIVAIDIPNQKNCIKKEALKKIIESVGIKAKTSNSIKDAIQYISGKNCNCMELKE